MRYNFFPIGYLSIETEDWERAFFALMSRRMSELFKSRGIVKVQTQ